MQAAEDDIPPPDASFVYGPVPDVGMEGADTATAPTVTDLWQDMMARWTAPAEPDPPPPPLQDEIWG